MNRRALLTAAAAGPAFAIPPARRGRVYQDMGALWYEEPLPPHYMEGYAELVVKLDIRIATGENLYAKYQAMAAGRRI